ncbi:MAG: SufE family protein [Muribaculaceae bacterium]|nr:SufE family protein [Muribaculaceae bacterium]
MSDINTIQDEIIDEFEGFDDWMDRYAVIIDMGNALPALDEQYKTPDNIIEGCQSRVWLQADYSDGKMRFRADSDAIIVKGIISMLVRVLGDHTPDEVLAAELYFIDRIGLHEHLSPTRSNGLLAMIKKIHAYALAFKAQAQPTSN